MISVKRKAIIGFIGCTLSFGIFCGVVLLKQPINIQAATSNDLSAKANIAITNLESSLKKNWLGAKNLPGFNSYLKDSKVATNKLANGSVKTSYNNRIAETERIIKATQAVVLLESSLEKNYHGMRNISTFKAYLDKANKEITTIKTIACKYKLSNRTYISFNTIRDIEVVNSLEYKESANSFVDARKAYKEAMKSKDEQQKNKAMESANNALNLGWKINSSVAKDYLISDIKDILSSIKDIEVLVPKKDEKATEEVVKETKTEENI